MGNLMESRRRVLMSAPHLETIENADIASFNTNMRAKIKDLTVSVDPVQDLHGYDNPWPAGGGKNLCAYDTPYIAPTENTQTVNVFTMDLVGGTTYTFSCKQSANLASSTRNTLVVKPDGGTATYESTGTNFNPTDLRHKLTFTADTTGEYVFGYWGHTLSASVTLSEWQVEISSSFTTYVPYSNICPISGWSECNVWRTGKNLLDLSTLRGGTFNEAKSFPVANISTDGYIPVKPGETYTWSQASYSPGGSSGRYIRWYDKDKALLGSHPSIYVKEAYTFQVPDNVYYARFMWYYGASPLFQSINDVINMEPIVKLGSTATAYELYQGNQYTIQLGQTVYGGTLDVTNGVLTVDRAMVDLEALSWGNWNSVNGWIAEISLAIKQMASNNDPMNAIASDLKVVSKVESLAIVSAGTNEDTISAARTGVYVYGTNANRKPTGQLVYELATPIEYDLTPEEVATLLGANAIWADTGNVINLYYWKK